MKNSEPIQALKLGSSAAFNQTVAEIQDFGYKHFQEGGWKDGNKLFIENIVNELQQEHRSCYACPIGCGVVSRIKKGEKTPRPVDPWQRPTGTGDGSAALQT